MDIMDDKTFVTTYVTQETQRINERLKRMLETDGQPSEEEKNSVIADIETTLARLQSALMHINATVEENDE